MVNFVVGFSEKNIFSLMAFIHLLIHKGVCVCVCVPASAELSAGELCEMQWCPCLSKSRLEGRDLV